MIEISATVEYNLSDASGQRALTNQGAHLGGGLQIGLLQLKLLGAGAAEGHTLGVIDHLGIYVLVREIDSQTGTLRRTGKLLADTRMNAGTYCFAIDSAHILLINF